MDHCNPPKEMMKRMRGGAKEVCTDHAAFEEESKEK